MKYYPTTLISVLSDYLYHTPACSKEILSECKKREHTDEWKILYKDLIKNNKLTLENLNIDRKSERIDKQNFKSMYIYVKNYYIYTYFSFNCFDCWLYNMFKEDMERIKNITIYDLKIYWKKKRNEYDIYYGDSRGYCERQCKYMNKRKIIMKDMFAIDRDREGICRYCLIDRLKKYAYCKRCHGDYYL